MKKSFGAILKIDSRDKHFHEFGEVTEFVPESNFGIGVPLLIEKAGEVDCTALSTIKVATSQTKQQYDVDTLWAETPHNAFGADPRDTLKTAIIKGLKNLATGLFEKPFAGYWQANTSNIGQDAFDATRSAMTIAQSSCTVASEWYTDWQQCQSLEVMPFGDILVSEHDYVILDWKIVNGVTMFVIDSHQGYTTYMPREVFNLAMSHSGCGSYMPANKEISAIVNRTFVQYLIDACQNLILLLRAKLAPR